MIFPYPNRCATGGGDAARCGISKQRFSSAVNAMKFVSTFRSCSLRRVLAGVAALVFTIAWAPRPAKAQGNALKLAVSPLRAEFALQPGAAYTDSAHVTNDGLAPVRLEATVNDWTLAADGSPIFLDAGAAAPDEFACAAWIHVSPENFELAPGQMQRVRYTIQVPAGTRPLGCRAALLFTSAPPTQRAEGKQVLTVARLASIIYIRVGNPEALGTVTNLALAPRPRAASDATGEPALEIALGIRNQGRTYFRAEGQIQLLDATGKTLAQLPLDSQIVLPASQRIFAFPIAATLGPGTYELRATINMGEPTLLQVRKTVVIGAAPPAATMARLGHAQ